MAVRITDTVQSFCVTRLELKKVFVHVKLSAVSFCHGNLLIVCFFFLTDTFASCAVAGLKGTPATRSTWPATRASESMCAAAVAKPTAPAQSPRSASGPTRASSSGIASSAPIGVIQKLDCVLVAKSFKSLVVF
jgi:hypothetical protein